MMIRQGEASTWEKEAIGVESKMNGKMSDEEARRKPKQGKGARGWD
jgi:hypothetical protein